MRFTEIQALFLALAVLAAFFLFLAFFTRKRGFQSIPDFFLAGRRVPPYLVVSLLLSGSFSLNGMLYQIYLGYKIGFWSLLTQAAWASSFFLLAPFSKTVANSGGLHSFLGSTYSPATRQLAAACSIIGLSFQIGWEYNVAKSAISGLTDPPLPSVVVGLAVMLILGVTTFYTLLGGLRSNVWTDLFQNALKGACFIVLAVLAISATARIVTTSDFWTAAKTPFSAAVAELTLVGFLTNLAFSLAWQFVDMTTWQSVAATDSNANPTAARKILYWSVPTVFIAPGVIGTIIGISLTGQTLDSNSVLPALLGTVGTSSLIVFILTIAIAATAMSFVDGMLLGVGFTLITDLLFRKQVDRYRLLDQPSPSEAADPSYRQRVATIVGWTRIALIAAAIGGTYVLSALGDLLHLDLFGLVYIVIVSQLALLGPVLIGLLRREAKPWSGPAAIVVGLVVGHGLAVLGGFLENEGLTSGSSVFALLASLSIAFLGSRTRTASAKAR